jgi:hypothetical protein
MEAAISSDLIYLGIGAAVGLGISVGVAWPHRAELKQGWSDLLGLPHRFSVGERLGPSGSTIALRDPREGVAAAGGA